MCESIFYVPSKRREKKANRERKKKPNSTMKIQTIISSSFLLLLLLISSLFFTPTSAIKRVSIAHISQSFYLLYDTFHFDLYTFRCFQSYVVYMGAHSHGGRKPADDVVADSHREFLRPFLKRYVFQFSKLRLGREIIMNKKMLTLSLPINLYILNMSLNGRVRHLGFV